jgi:hypothetical protein
MQCYVRFFYEQSGKENFVQKFQQNFWNIFFILEKENILTCDEN